MLMDALHTERGQTGGRASAYIARGGTTEAPNALTEMLEELLRTASDLVSRDPQAARASIERASSLIRGAGSERYELLRVPGGLNPWQEAQAKALLEKSITGPCDVAKIAERCDLTQAQFTRAFQRTTGLSPLKWLRKLRVARAKELLYSSHLTLAQITYECGYADQAHFTRAFAAATGDCPGAWRRARRAA